MNHSPYRQHLFKRPGFLSAIHGFFFRTGKANAGVVMAGQGQVSREGSTLTIEQLSQEMILAWQDFDLGPDESVHIHQPDATAIALIRVTGSKASTLMGRVRANGQVFILNENGVLIGEAAEVDAAGLVVTALGLSDRDFLAGRRNFSGESAAGVTNQGTLRARDGGYVALLGQQVNNKGMVTANLGSIALVAASQVALKLAGEALLDATVEKAACDALAENLGHMQADGGHVLMRTGIVDAPLNTVIRNEGVIRAQAIDNQGGMIRLLGGEEGVTVVSGTLDASAPEKGDGGRIETCGAHVKIMDAARILTTAISGMTGQWLVDPPDFTVAPSGGDITGAALSAQLNTTNVTLQSSQGTVNPNGSGNLYINDAVSWGANTTLTLEAVNDININSTIKALGSSAGLVLTPGSGQYRLAPGVTIIVVSPTAHLSISGNTYTVIRDINALQSIPAGSSGNYALGIDLDASTTSTWNGGAGFAPIVDFRGNFDGLGHTISNLTINRPTERYTALFGFNDGAIQNIGLANCSVMGLDYVGGLTGFNRGTVGNCFAISNVTGTGFSEGGLAGSNVGLISNCYAEGHVTGTGTGGNTAIFGSHVGGLVGRNDGRIESSYATATVQGQTTQGSAAGGYAGGLTGFSSEEINNCYATGSVSGSQFRGGLTGVVNGIVNASYATGHVDGTGNVVGGLAGINNGTVTNSYWDIQTTGQIRSAGGTGLTTAQMQDPNYLVGFDFTNIWRIYAGHTYPLLRAFLTPLTIVAADATKSYDGTPYISASGISCAPGPCPASHLYNTSGFMSLSGQPARNAGTYQIVSDAYSDQQGYDINAVPGTLTVTPAPLTITAVPDSKVYDGTTVSHAVPQVTGLQDGDTISNLTQSFTNKYAGAQGVDVDSGYVINDGNNGQNYIVTTHAAIAYIQRRRLTVTGLHALDKVYDGTNHTEIQGGALQGGVPGDDVTLVNGVGTFNDKNVGVNKPVIVTGMSLTGRDAFNYILENPPGLFASITPKPLTVTGLVVQDKTYDGTNTATLLGGMLQGIVSGDDANLANGIATFSDRNAGTNKPVTVTGMALTGADAGNYLLIQPVGLTGTIYPAQLIITLTYDTKVYDGTIASAVMPQVSGLVNSDSISNLSQSFDSKNAGRHHMVLNSGYVINDGNGGNNYTVSIIDGLGTISPASLTITAVPDSKTYDGSVASSGIPQVYGLVNGDTVTNLSQTFDSRNAGPRILTVNGGYLVNDDNGGNNYNVSLVTANGTISQASLVLSAVPDTRVYDGTTVSTGMPQASGLVNGDTVSGLSQSFDSRNAGSRTLAVNGSYVMNDGNGGNNYAVTLNAANGMIEQAPLAISAVPDTKAYDGTITSKGTPMVSGLVNGDTVTNLSQSFDNKNAGNRALVVNASYSINDGNGGNNYAVIVNTAMGTIDPATLTLAAVPDTKVYDGTTASNRIPLAIGLMAGDMVTIYSQAFDNKNAGARLLVITGYALSDGNYGNNYRVTITPATGQITPAPLTLSAVPDTKVYDATTSSKGVPQATGLVNGDTVSSLAQAFDDKNAGSRTLAVNEGYVINDGNGGNNYVVKRVPANGSIDRAPLTISAVPDIKVYDGTTISSGMPIVSGLANGDTASGLNQSFDSRNIGSRTLVINGDYFISDGNGGNNYVITLHTTDGTIEQAPLTITAVSDTKVYDGTTTSRGIPQVSGLVNGDTVTNLSQAFESKNAGNRVLAVNSNFSINDGNGGNNYGFVVNTAMGTIDPATLTIAAIPDTKAYDGNVTSAGVPEVSGLVAGDTVTDLNQAFDNKNAGARMLVVTGYALNDGNSGNNYRVTVSPATGQITPAQLTLSAVPDTKVYDATTSSKGIPQAAGLVNGDTVSSLAQAFDNKNAGSRTLAVDGGYVINDGNGGNNYTVMLNTANGSIDQAPLTIAAVSDTRVYDGSNVSTPIPVATGLVNGDTVGQLRQVFDSRNAGSRTLIVNGDYVISDGNGGNNYRVTTNTANGTITQAALTITAMPDSKVYDGTAASSVMPVTAGLVNGDTVSGLNQAFDSKNAGTRTLVVNGNYVINDGNGGNNYLVKLLPAQGTIDRAPLVVSAVSDTKVYDGTTTSTRQPTATGLVNGDTVTNLSQSFDSRDAGNRLLRVNGYVLNDGNNGNNYAVTTQTAPGSITPKALTVSGQVALNKTYDGTNQATLQGGTLVGVVGGDNVTLVNGTATFNDRNAGTSKPVTVTGTTLGGTNAGNYTVSNPTGLTASINPASLTLSAVSDSKVYDGTTVSTKAPVASGLVSGDTISTLSQSFDSKNAGSRTLRVNSGYVINDGNNGKNYTVTTKTATGTISKAALKLQAVPDTKKFDNTTISRKIPLALGLVAGDTVSKLTQSFDKKTPGVRTLVVNSGYVVNDTNNGNNYTVTTATAPGLITP